MIWLAPLCTPCSSTRSIASLLLQSQWLVWCVVLLAISFPTLVIETIKSTRSPRNSWSKSWISLMVIVYNLWSCGLSGGRPYRGEANLGSFNRNNQMSCLQNIILLRIKTCQCISTWHCAPILEVDPNPELISPFFGFFTLSGGSSIPWRSRLRVLQLKQSNVMFIKISSISELKDVNVWALRGVATRKNFVTLHQFKKLIQIQNWIQLVSDWAKCTAMTESY